MMLMPSIFGESLIDDFMRDFTFPVSRSSRCEMPLQGVMKTDIRETENEYVLDIDLPGYKKEDVKAQLKDGYLNISVSREENKEEKDAKDKYLRKERYTGSVSRSFYVGENLSEEDIKAKFADGILTLSFPKEAPKKVEESKFISIEG